MYPSVWRSSGRPFRQAFYRQALPPSTSRVAFDTSSRQVTDSPRALGHQVTLSAAAVRHRSTPPCRGLAHQTAAAHHRQRRRHRLNLPERRIAVKVVSSGVLKSSSRHFPLQGADWKHGPLESAHRLAALEANCTRARVWSDMVLCHDTLVQGAILRRACTPFCDTVAVAACPVLG